MRFNKVIRDYLNEQINTKKEEARVNNPLYIEYNNKREEATKKIEELRVECMQKITDVLEEYGMDTTIDSYGKEFEASDLIFNLRESFIHNEARQKEINTFNSKLYKKAQDFAKEIELECALGGDKAKFMKMIEDIKF